MTLKCLKEHVPDNIGGIVFLSGGQSSLGAIRNLNAMHQMSALPWPLSFSYGRAIQNSALKSWAKNPNNAIEAQKLLLKAAQASSQAVVGQYKTA
jgi:fructose-bisphosphate aldolase class I